MGPRRGLQWAGTAEFQSSGNLGINFGGGSQSRGYGGLCQTNKPFEWKVGRWYHFHVLRLERISESRYEWGFRVQDIDTKFEVNCGTIHTQSEFITQALVFTETGYGVKCDTPPAVVLWSDPIFNTAGGVGTPDRAVATYNGTCVDPHNTNQYLISLNPMVWFHSLKSQRTAENGAPIWTQEV